MLDLLHIENIAIIERADIAFQPGFNALTGETGAGKSIVIDAMSAVLDANVTTIIAAVVLTILPEWLRFLQDYRMLIYAVVLIGMMLFNASPKLHGWVVSAKKSIAVFFRKLFHLQKKEAAD